MHTIAAARLLSLWEEFRHHPSTLQALALLQATYPEASPDALDAPVHWTIGRRNVALLNLRQALFGVQIEAIAVCPQCGEQLELVLRTDELLPDRQAAAWSHATGNPAVPLQVSVDGITVQFRLPDSRDLVAVQAAPTAGVAEQQLLEGCLLEVWRHEMPDTHSSALVDAIVRTMAAADPLGDIEFAMRCPTCGYAWLAPFDLVAYLWLEITDWARRLLGEVHELARAYGWREADILALTPQRRQAYLEMIQS